MKLAYLYNVMKFIYWQSENIKFCILGENPFGDKINSILNKKIQNKKIVFLNLFDKNELNECNIIFISKSEKNLLKDILEDIDKNILTISDIEDFSKRGGMVELKTINENVKIFINLKRVNKSDLKISAKLLEVAIIIK